MSDVDIDYVYCMCESEFLIQRKTIWRQVPPMIVDKWLTFLVMHISVQPCGRMSHPLHSVIMLNNLFSFIWTELHFVFVK